MESKQDSPETPGSDAPRDDFSEWGGLWGVGLVARAVGSVWFVLTWMPPLDPLCADLQEGQSNSPRQDFFFFGKDAV